MKNTTKQRVLFNGKVVMIGFGSIGKAVLPLLFKHLQMKPNQVQIFSINVEDKGIAKEQGSTFTHVDITKNNYRQILDNLQPGDFLLNLSVDISSIDLITLCQQKGALYLDTCTEPWKGMYVNGDIPASLRTNYWFREEVLTLKGKYQPTAVITHGANPGMVSHFVKQALLNLAADTGMSVTKPTSAEEWAALSQLLGIKAIHIAELDTQSSRIPKQIGEFVNTWSVDGFMVEGAQPSELGWGTHERHWPHDAKKFDFGCRSAIYLNRPGGSQLVRTWTPTGGMAQGFLITHAESISISNYLTLKKGTEVLYRPTVYYAYTPCPDARLSMHELAANEWVYPERKRLIFDEIETGLDELGVLLMGNPKGAYWYGSQLSIEEARRIAPQYNNATSLQVVAGVLSGLLWALEHPNRGLVEPEDLDHHYMMGIAAPYLGTMAGYYTDWTPLQGRGLLFAETLDKTDPWQFINFRVT